MNPLDSIRRILTVFRDTQAEIRPHFFLTGSSGSSKTYAETLKVDLDKAKIDLVNLITAEYPSNTIGIRLVNKLIHQYFIDGSPKTKPKKKMEL